MNLMQPILGKTRTKQAGHGQKTVISCLRSLTTRFRRNREGTSAVEFSFVAAPFFAILFAVFETAFAFFGELMLESGLKDAARMIRTGQAQEQGFDENQFRQAVCDNMLGLLSCDGNLIIDVRAFDDFNQVVVPPPLNEQGELAGGFGYADGTQGSVIVARAFYTWELLVPMPSHAGLGNMANGDRLLVAVTAFRNEPFEDEDE
ncbi:hypothetical protein MNBD_ALPHA09-852 [hydrothermal vent metagenome]|uniref:TadE-like domain-containing protein n=1 Tax=hydrothermal vent metagenome TaxID=652676 RepID=A0A3B0TM35_9ZZZZ